MKLDKQDIIAIIEIIILVVFMMFMCSLSVIQFTTDHENRFSLKMLSAVNGNMEINQISISDEEITYIVDTVFQLAGDLSFETQVCVSQVILNRLESPDYPNTIEEVVDDICQSNIRYANFDETLPEYNSILEQAYCDTLNAVTSSISMNQNIIKLPKDVTIMSVDKLDFEEWTSDCVDGIRFYKNRMLLYYK